MRATWVRARRAVGAVAMFAVCATACGSDPTNEIVATQPFDRVLLEYFGTTDTEAYLASAERSAAELVATCMQDAGFEFQIPPPVSQLTTPDPNDVDQAREQGFGIIAGYRHQVSQIEPFSERNDPNVAYLSTLSAAEIDRFFITLEGEEAEPGQRQTGGCNNQASEEAYAQWQRFSELLPNYTALGEERDTHPDWLAARADWQTCMIERGFDYSEPDAIRTDVIARMRERVAEVYPGGQVPIVEIDGAIVVDPEVDVLLDDLVQFEKEAAVANAECTAPVAHRFAEVERLVQQDFVDRNRTAIDELLEGSP